MFASKETVEGLGVINSDSTNSGVREHLPELDMVCSRSAAKEIIDVDRQHQSQWLDPKRAGMIEDGYSTATDNCLSKMLFPMGTTFWMSVQCFVKSTARSALFHVRTSQKRWDRNPRGVLTFEQCLTICSDSVSLGGFVSG